MLILIFLIVLALARPDWSSAFFEWLKTKFPPPHETGSASSLTSPQLQSSSAADRSSISIISSLTGSLVYEVSGGRKYYLPTTVVLSLAVHNPQTDQFTSVNSVLTGTEGRFKFKNVPCGRSLRVFVENLMTDGSDQVTWKKKWPPWDWGAESLPCEKTVDIGEIQLNLTPIVYGTEVNPSPSK
jgi:hypothetical protein